MLSLNSGLVGIAPGDDVEEPGRFGIEYRHTPVSRWRIRPALGYALSENDAQYSYLDLKRNFWLTDRWVVTPSTGVGYFDSSPEIQLGHEIEFRLAIETSYRVYKKVRLGVALDHLSNSSLSERNPGIESFIFTLLIPLR